jgi:hypothetical protein
MVQTCAPLTFYLTPLSHVGIPRIRSEQVMLSDVPIASQLHH